MKQRARHPDAPTLSRSRPVRRLNVASSRSGNPTTTPATPSRRPPGSDGHALTVAASRQVGHRDKSRAPGSKHGRYTAVNTAGICCVNSTVKPPPQKRPTHALAFFVWRQPDQKSRLDTAKALASMKSRRGSTASPMRVLKIWSAPMASSMVTLSMRRTLGSMVVSHS